MVSVDAPHFNAGLVIVDGQCVKAAPILRWAIGRAAEDLSSEFRAKGWKATQRLLDQPQGPSNG